MVDQVIQFILDPQLEGPLLLLKIVCLVYSFFFLIFLVWGHINSGMISKFFMEDVIEFTTYKPYGILKFAKRWQKITKRLERELESEYKLAIIEADIMLDDILREAGYAGETIGDRLVQLTSDAVPDLQKLLEAHKIRNSIIHDPDYRITLDETRDVLDTYERAMKSLQPF